MRSGPISALVPAASVVVGVTGRAVLIEPDWLKRHLVDRRDMARRTLVETGIPGLDDVPVVVEFRHADWMSARRRQ